MIGFTSHRNFLHLLGFVLFKLFVRFYLQSAVHSIAWVNPEPITVDLARARSQDNLSTSKYIFLPTQSSSLLLGLNLVVGHPIYYLPFSLSRSFSALPVSMSQACHASPIRYLWMRNRGSDHFILCSSLQLFIYFWIKFHYVIKKLLRRWLFRTLRLWTPSLWNVKQVLGKIE